MAATRRLAAVLAADMVGYSRLMSFDEEGTLGRLGVLRTQLIDPKIAEHGGRLVKTTGDGLLIEFPSSIGALRCAMDMQAGVAERETGREDRRIRFRIGIHQGDIIVDDTEDIHGNGVNIAARLEGLAEPGGICISDRVQEDASGRVEAEFEDIGEQPLKNIERPPRRIYRVYPIAEAVVVPLGDEPVEPPPSNAPSAPVEEAPRDFTLGELFAAPPEDFLRLVADMRHNPSHELHGLFTGPPATEALGALVADWLQCKVEVEHVAGGWRPLVLDQRTALPFGRVAGTRNRLGIDSVLGMRAWDPQVRAVLRIGPLDHATFARLQPDQPEMQRLVSLAREVLGPELGFAINPVLAGSEVRRLSLAAAAESPPCLGWNTWLPAREPNVGATPPDAADAIFQAEAVEAEERARLAAQ
ncbi:MAG TPA: type VI secretion system baseplate subunit TssG [Stellaceae bacterium]|nr:type VI secretion system baseplate subunit TssG [Stellaceae bacterium]